MTRELAMVHAREGIRFNSICPGPLKTRTYCGPAKYVFPAFLLPSTPTALLMNFLDTDEKRNRRLVHLPMGRFGEAVEIAQGALFCAALLSLSLTRFSSHPDPDSQSVASDESSYITGADFKVDGVRVPAFPLMECFLAHTLIHP